jgi:hypothetical protein
MTSLCKIWNTPYSEVLKILQNFEIRTKTETGAYIRMSQKYASLHQLPPHETELVQNLLFQRIMLETESLPLDQRLIAGITRILKDQNSSSTMQDETLKTTIQNLEEELKLERKQGIKNKKLIEKRCVLSNYDDETDKIIDPVSMEQVDETNFIVLNDRCYNISSIQGIVNSNNRTDPITREPLPQRIIDQFLNNTQRQQPIPRSPVTLDNLAENFIEIIHRQFPTLSREDILLVAEFNAVTGIGGPASDQSLFSQFSNANEEFCARLRQLLRSCINDANYVSQFNSSPDPELQRLVFSFIDSTSIEERRNLRQRIDEVVRQRQIPSNT